MSKLALLFVAATLAPVASAGDPLPVFSDPLASTNPYAPFEEGGVKVYRGRSEDGPLTVVDEFSSETRTFSFGGQEVECHLLREVEFAAGELVEISRNWFAESDDGTVWYFGETVDDYEDGEVVGHEGSWLVGGPTRPDDPPETATAETPAVFMPSDPQVGDQWKPEDLFPLVDETVTALDDDARVKTPALATQEALLVEETSELPGSEPELKWYVAGVGFVKAKGDGEKLVLVASSFLPEEDDEGDD